MKMVKSLLLGSAAGLVAVVGAQAADLPVKAKPVEYVKVCTLYGAGFWYVPGTDTCIKIGSYIRVQTEYGAAGGGIPIGAADGTTGGRFTRSDTSEFGFRVRGALSLDLRTQTEYGTLRSYLNTGTQVTTTSNSAADNNAVAGDSVWADRAFIQFAGFTAGRIRSFFDINTFAPYSYNNTRVQGDTGALGIYGIGYTAQLGNGFSATIAVEDGGASNGGRGYLTSDVTNQVWAPVGAAVRDNRGVQFPDLVGNLRVDQAWGYAQIAAAVHDVSGAYFNQPFGATAGAAQNFCGTGVTTGSLFPAAFAGVNCTPNGHPDDELGWAVTAGFTLNDVLGMKGDKFGAQAAFAHGASGYVTRALGTWTIYSAGNSVGLGYLADAIFASNLGGGGTNLELTDSWGVHAFYEHRWDPKWKTSLYGGFVQIDYNNNATAIICSGNFPAFLGTGPRGPTGATIAATGVGGSGFFPGAVSSCDPDYSWWQVGTRTQWNPHPDLDIGLDLLYTRLNTAYKGFAFLGPSGARPAGLYSIDDQEVFSAMMRIQRNFLP